MRKPDHWFLAGSVERGARYESRNGYSRVPEPGIMQYPWSTSREAQTESKQRGMLAVFHETREDADNAHRSS